MEEEKWWAGEDRAPTLRPLLVRGQGNEICRKPKGIRKFRETLSHGCTANMICASLRSGGRRLAVRTVMEHPIGALPRTPFASSRRSPQGETRDMRKRQGSHMLHVPLRCFPLWWLAPPPFPRKRGHNKAPRFHLFISGSTLSTGCSAPACGGSPAQPDRGWRTQ